MKPLTQFFTKVICVVINANIAQCMHTLIIIVYLVVLWNRTREPSAD